MLKVWVIYWGIELVIIQLLLIYSGDVFEGEILNIPKFDLKTLSVVKYECVADNGIGDTLRKTITIHLRGKSFI